MEGRNRVDTNGTWFETKERRNEKRKEIETDGEYQYDDGTYDDGVYDDGVYDDVSNE